MMTGQQKSSHMTLLFLPLFISNSWEAEELQGYKVHKEKKSTRNRIQAGNDEANCFKPYFKAEPGP